MIEVFYLKSTSVRKSKYSHFTHQLFIRVISSSLIQTISKLFYKCTKGHPFFVSLAFLPSCQIPANIPGLLPSKVWLTASVL